MGCGSEKMAGEKRTELELITRFKPATMCRTLILGEQAREVAEHKEYD